MILSNQWCPTNVHRQKTPPILTTKKTRYHLPLLPPFSSSSLLLGSLDKAHRWLNHHSLITVLLCVLTVLFPLFSISVGKTGRQSHSSQATLQHTQCSLIMYKNIGKKNDCNVEWSLNLDSYKCFLFILEVYMIPGLWEGANIRENYQLDLSASIILVYLLKSPFGGEVPAHWWLTTCASPAMHAGTYNFELRSNMKSTSCHNN